MGTAGREHRHSNKDSVFRSNAFPSLPHWTRLTDPPKKNPGFLRDVLGLEGFLLPDLSENFPLSLHHTVLYCSQVVSRVVRAVSVLGALMYKAGMPECLTSQQLIVPSEDSSSLNYWMIPGSCLSQLQSCCCSPRLRLAGCTHGRTVLMLTVVLLTCSYIWANSSQQSWCNILYWQAYNKNMTCMSWSYFFHIHYFTYFKKLSFRDLFSICGLWTIL